MNALIRLLMLLWIEIKRCQGVFVAPLVAVLVIWIYQSDGRREGLVVWRDVSMNVAESAYIVGSIGAALAVWGVDRPRRRRTQDQEAAFPVPRGRTTLVSMLAVLTWMLCSYAMIFAFFGIPAMLDATWGGPDLALLLIGVLTISVCVAIGAVVGWFGRSPVLAPLTLFLVYAGNVYAADSMYNNPRGILVPIRFLGDNNFSLSYPLPVAAIWSMIGWLAACTLFLGLIALLLRERSFLRIAGSVVSVVLVIVSANQVMAERDSMLGPEGGLAASTVSIEPECRQGEVIEVCLHPAYSALLDEVVAAADQMYRPLAGLPGVPDRLVDGALNPGDLEGTGGVYIFVWDKSSIGRSIGESLQQIFIGRHSETGLMTASQCVILEAVSSQAYPHYCTSGLVAENPAAMGPGSDEGGGNQWEAKIQAKVERFEALSAEEQRDWLEANWDDLRAGELTLDDLP